MTKKSIKIAKPEQGQEIYTIGNIQEFVEIANTQLAEMLYISKDNEKGEHSYRGDFRVLNKKELEKLAIKMPKIYAPYKYFVYNECEEKILPLKKNNCLTHEHGHFDFDGKDCISRDNNGDVIFKFPFSAN